jgi:hypothetical protein
MRTRDALGVFWDGEEVEGALFYVLWAGEILTPPTFPLGLWPSATEVRPRRLWGDGWTVWLWEVRIRSWPAEDEWQGLINRTLGELLSAGAAISWCAVEGCFVDPPNLFDPTTMSDGVWSCQSKAGTSVPPLALEGEFRYVSSRVLARLQGEATRLLDGPEEG